MNTTGKILLGLALAATTIFASCNGCNEGGDGTTKNGDTTIIDGIVLVDGQTIDNDGNLIDKDGNIVKSSAELQQERAAKNNNTDGNGNNSNAAPYTEKDFVYALIKANTMQITLLEAGAKNSSDAKMRDASSKMLGEHIKLRNEINTFAQVHGYGLPDLTAENNATVNADAGAAWDKAYASKIANNDNEIINIFNKGKTDVSNSDLQIIITDFLPKVQQHSSDVASWNMAM